MTRVLASDTVFPSNVNRWVFKRSKAAALDVTGPATFTIPANAFTRSDAVKSVATTVTVQLGSNLALTLREIPSPVIPGGGDNGYAAGIEPALVDPLVAITPAANAIQWIAPGSVVELSAVPGIPAGSDFRELPRVGSTYVIPAFDAATGATSALNGDGTAGATYQSLFFGAPVPGDANGAFALNASNLVVPGSTAASSPNPAFYFGAYRYAVSLAGALPGRYSVSVPQGTVSWVSSFDMTRRTTAGGALNFFVGFPSSVTFEGKDGMTLMESATRTVRIAKGADMASSQTVFAVIAVTVPAGVANATAVAVGMAESFRATAIPLSTFLVASMGVVEPTAAEDQVRTVYVINTTVYYRYKVDAAASTYAVDTWGWLTVKGGAACGMVAGQSVCNAVARDVVEVRYGASPAAAAGRVHPDGDMYAVTTGDLVPTITGPVVQLPGSVAITIAGVAATAQAAIIGGMTISGPSSALEKNWFVATANTLTLTIPNDANALKALTPGVYTVSIAADAITATVPTPSPVAWATAAATPTSLPSSTASRSASASMTAAATQSSSQSAAPTTSSMPTPSSSRSAAATTSSMPSSTASRSASASNSAGSTPSSSHSAAATATSDPTVSSSRTAAATVTSATTVSASNSAAATPSSMSTPSASGSAAATVSCAPGGPDCPAPARRLGEAETETDGTNGRQLLETSNGARALAAPLTVGSARITFTVTIGFDARFLSFTPGQTPGSGTTAADYLTRRGFNGPFFTKNDEVRLRIFGATLEAGAAPVLFSSEAGSRSVLAGVYAASDASMSTNLAGGLVGAADQPTFSTGFLEYRVGLAGLVDGEYIFVIDGTDASLTGAAARTTAGVQNSTVRLVVDRTAPAATAQTYANRVGPVVAPLLANVPVSAPLPVPAALFSDAGSSDAWLTVSIANPSELRGMALVGSKLGAATLVSTAAVRPPTGNAVLSIVATDEAGNAGTGSFTLPVRTQVGSVLTLIDRRGVQTRNSMTSGAAASISGSLAAGSMPLKVVVDFDEPVTGVSRASLGCTLDGAACPTTATGVVVSATPGGRRYTFDFSVPAAALSEGAVLSTYVSGAGVTTSTGGLTVRSSNAASIVVDQAAPTVGRAGVRTTPNVQAFYPLPAGFCADAATGIDGLRATASTPSSSNGFSFVQGAFGTAGFTGSASAVTVNPIEFAVACTDAAGNVGTGSFFIEVVALPVGATTTPVSSFTLDATNTPVAFTESLAETGRTTTAEVFPSAIFTLPAAHAAGRGIFRVGIYLTGMDTTADGALVETIRIADSLLASGVVGVGGTAVANLITGVYSAERRRTEIILYKTTASGGFTASEVQAILRGVTYVNDRFKVTSGTRSVRVTVGYAASAVTDATVPAVLATRPAFIAVGSRQVRVTGTNQLPLAPQTAATATWTEPASATAPSPLVDVMTSRTFTDADDTEVSSLTVSIRRTQDDTVDFDGCDPVRDMLVLPSNYVNDYAAPLVQGLWSSATCSLVLTPVAPATRVSDAAMTAALNAVKYTNMDVQNPWGWMTTVASGNADSGAGTAYGKRNLFFTVTDSANSGNLATPASSAAPAAAAGTLLTIVRVDDNAVADLGKLYGVDGPFYSDDTFAQSSELVISGKEYVITRFPLVIKANETGTKTFSVTFDLSQDKTAAGAYINGSYAKGAILDSDTASVTVSNLEVCTGFASSAGTGCAAFAAPFAATFTFAQRAVSTLSLTVSTVDSLTEAQLGAKLVKLTANGVDLYFYLDVLYEGCKDDAASTVILGNPGTARETYILRAMDASEQQWYGYTSSLGAAGLDKFYNAPQLCKYAPVVFNGTAETAVGSSDFAEKAGALETAAAALADAPEAVRIAALASARREAAGQFEVLFPPASLVGSGSIAVTSGVVDATTSATLLATVPGLGDEVQLNVAIQMGPPGTTFSKPVKICIFTGDTPSGSYKVLSVAAQIDAADASKGFTPFTALANQEFDIATGQVCGETTHFSIFAPIVQPVPFSPTVPKTFLMGGSCPNACTGKGACRQDGKCICFPGFDGYDCSARACPSAESWGEDQETHHAQSECSGRGTCERTAGTCQCLDGFEGAACERMACPSDCSGHGKCRLLAELPKVQQAGYSSWESKRIQVCACDGGYTGYDCSERTCPLGDDPETNCYGNAALGIAGVQRQVQRLTFAFNSPAPPVQTLDEADDAVLTFTSSTGRNYTTPRIENIFDNGADDITKALRALPEFSVMDVTVMEDAAASTSTALLSTVVNPVKSFLVTFTGETSTGNQPLLQCPTTLGCPAPGCQPKYKQMRILSVTPSSGGSVAVNEFTMLVQPPALTAATVTAGVWGVETTLTFTRYNTVLGFTYTYQFR